MLLNGHGFIYLIKNKIKSKLEGELKLAILKKAALLEKDDFKKFKETKGKNKGKTVIKKK